jgi:hypothetical protein
MMTWEDNLLSCDDLELGLEGESEPEQRQHIFLNLITRRRGRSTDP